jgi:hypothetical protein
MIAKENGYNELANLLVQLAPMPQAGAYGPRLKTDEHAEKTVTSGKPEDKSGAKTTKVKTDGIEKPIKEEGSVLADKGMALDGPDSAALVPASNDIKAKPGYSALLPGSAHGRRLYTILLVLILVTATALLRW